MLAEEGALDAGLMFADMIWNPCGASEAK